MATRTIPQVRLQSCDICGVEQELSVGLAPFGLFTQLCKVVLIRHEIKGTIEVAMGLDCCNACYGTIARFVGAFKDSKGICAVEEEPSNEAVHKEES